MNVLRRINNNVVLVAHKGARMIVVGKGLGFKAYPGDEVNEAFVQQRFVLQRSEDEARYANLIQGIPFELLSLAHRVVDMVQRELGKELPATLELTLADHIEFAVARAGEGVAMDYPLAWEIGQFYPDEYRAGRMAADFICKELDVELPSVEAAFLAIHFVNALGGLSACYDASDLAEAMLHAVGLIEARLGAPLDQTSMAFSRFITHLRYCLVRCLNGDAEGSVGEDLLELAQVKYPEAFACAREVAAYVSSALSGAGFSQEAMQSEMFYLTLHINRLLTSEPSKPITNEDQQEASDEQ